MLLLLLACSSGTPVVGEDETAADSLALDGPAALDPVLGSASWTIEATADGAVTVAVLDASGAVVRTLSEAAHGGEVVSWDGRDEAGARVANGGYVVHAEGTDAGGAPLAAELDVAVVRVGVTAGTLGGDRIALAWHADGGVGGYFDGGTDTVTFTLAAIDAADGTAAAIPEPWDDLYAPPAEGGDANLPAAYAWDARPTLTVTVAGDVGDAALGARIEGWTLTDGTVSPGATLTFTKDTALAEGPRVVEETLRLEWLSGDVAIGGQDVPLRMYALLGPPAFEHTGMPYQPWVAVIDPALRAIDGVEPTEEAVLAGLVEHIYRDLALSYDTRWGASAYTQYQGNGWNNAHFDLSGFLDRTRGSVVNCTDCASILEAFANMVGATLSYTILTPNFDLNFIKAIGGDHFTQCPFGTGGCGFSYHAVTTPDDNGTIYDATLALDGDGDPGGYPATELLVQGISGEEYEELLVADGNPSYRYTQEASIQ